MSYAEHFVRSFYLLIFVPFIYLFKSGESEVALDLQRTTLSTAPTSTFNSFLRCTWQGLQKLSSNGHDKPTFLQEHPIQFSRASSNGALTIKPDIPIQFVSHQIFKGQLSADTSQDKNTIISILHQKIFLRP